MKSIITSMLAVALIGMASATCQAQAFWQAIAGTPNWTGFSSDLALQSPQADVLWGIESSSYGQGVSGSLVFNTADNGQSWQSVSVASVSQSAPATYVGNIAFCIAALDAQNAWLVRTSYNGSSPELLRTTSGPNGFAVIAPRLPAIFQQMAFFSATIGVGIANTRIYRTTNGGLTWSLVPGPAAIISNAILPQYDKKGNALHIALAQGNVLTTPDAGLTWTSSSTGLGANLLGVAFTDALHGLAYGYDSTQNRDLLARTTDGGTTWTTVVPVGRPRCTSVVALAGSPNTYLGCRDSVVSSSRGYYSVATRLTISRDGGTTWASTDTDPVPCKQLVSASPNQLWLGTYRNYSPLRPSPEDMLLRYVGNALASKEARSAAAFTVYPNPSTGLVTIARESAAAAQLRVYDGAGRCCQTIALANAQRQVDLSALPAGLYQLLLTAANGTVYHQRLHKL